VTRSDAYLLGRSEAEVERLTRQVAELERDTEWLLDRLDIRPGARAVDIGCGPAAGALPQLAKRAGPTGSAVGLDSSRQFVDLARRFLRDRGVTNAEVLEADAYDTGLPRASFDAAHMRLVLVNVPEPERIVAEVVALVRPGGMIASQEADFVGHLCDPPLAAWTRLLDAYHAYTRARGIDLYIGRRTHRLFRDAGIVDIRVDPMVRALPLGQPRRMLIWQFIGNARDGMVAEGFIGDAEMTASMAELKAHLDDPDTLVTGLFQFRVWGRKPG
jgi:ubiquinone/menaquinone biosynthesis C-methylase UbiE